VGAGGRPSGSDARSAGTVAKRGASSGRPSGGAARAPAGAGRPARSAGLLTMYTDDTQTGLKM
jgi:hypothetical protein